MSHLLSTLLLLSVCALPVVAPPRVPSVGEWAGIRAMKFLKCRYYRYDRSGRDVCEGDSIEDLREFPRHPNVLCPPSSLEVLVRTGCCVWIAKLILPVLRQ